MKLDLGTLVPLAFSDSPERNLQQDLLVRLSQMQMQAPVSGVLMGLGIITNVLRRAL